MIKFLTVARLFSQRKSNQKNNFISVLDMLKSLAYQIYLIKSVMYQQKI